MSARHACCEQATPSCADGAGHACVLYCCLAGQS